MCNTTQLDSETQSFFPTHTHVHAGIAASIGICNSLIVVVSFVWGVFVFGDQVNSIGGTAGFLLLLIAAVMGMAFASKPRQPANTAGDSSSSSSSSGNGSHKINGGNDHTSIAGSSDSLTGATKPYKANGAGGVESDDDNERTPLVSELLQPWEGDHEEDGLTTGAARRKDSKDKADKKAATRMCCGRQISLVALGYCGAVFNGEMSGRCVQWKECMGLGCAYSSSCGERAILCMCVPEVCVCVCA